MALAFQKVRPRPKPTQANILAWLGLAWPDFGLAWLGFWLQAKASTALGGMGAPLIAVVWHKCLLGTAAANV